MRCKTVSKFRKPVLTETKDIYKYYHTTTVGFLINQFITELILSFNDLEKMKNVKKVKNDSDCSSFF